MSTDRGNGPLRRAGLYLGLVSDDPQPASTYARGELTWFQLQMIGLYALLSGGLWVGWAARGGQTLVELAVFFSGLCLWMAFVGLRRSRTRPPPENVGGSS
jgi:hypothetical protein